MILSHSQTILVWCKYKALQDLTLKPYCDFISNAPIFLFCKDKQVNCLIREGLLEPREGAFVDKSDLWNNHSANGFSTQIKSNCYHAWPWCPTSVMWFTITFNKPVSHHPRGCKLKSLGFLSNSKICSFIQHLLSTLHVPCSMLSIKNTKMCKSESTV